MKPLPYIWTVIENIIALYVIVAIFHVASTPFERIVFAGLVMIYLSVLQFLATWGKGTMELAQGLMAEFESVLSAIGKDTTEYRETMQHSKESVQPTIVKY